LEVGHRATISLQLLIADNPATSGRRPLVRGRGPTAIGCPNTTICKKENLPLAFFFLHMWSTLPHWLQHMPALPRLLLKTSNTHNFWSVVPKIMKFVLTWSLLWDACSQKVSENLKIKWDQVTMPNTGLSTVQTFGPLGINSFEIILEKIYFMVIYGQISKNR
jgi:hypothetical protein